VVAWLGRLFGKGATIRARDTTGNFAIGVEGNVTQVFVQAESGIFGATPSEPELPFVALENAIVNGKPDISRLLRWNYELVRRLHGRADDVRAIIEWAESDDPQILLRFVEGEGGAGKTRLAAEVARKLRERGWAAGFLGRAGPMVHAPSARGLFLIIDYPEEQPQRIDALIGAIRDYRKPGYKLRFLLLSRRSFEAWKDTVAPIRDLCGQHPIAHLGSLSPDAARLLVDEAVARLSELLGRKVQLNLAALNSWLERDEVHRLSLYTTAAAVHFVLIPTVTFDLSAPAILSELVEREMQRIRGASEAAGLGRDALPRFLALAALTGAISVTGIRRLADPQLEITQCPQTQIIDRIAALPWWDGERHRLPSLTPDPLAAAFSSRVFDDRPDIAPNWLYPAMEDRVDAEFAGIFGRLVHDMDRLRLAGPSPVPGWLEQMVDRDPGRAAAFRALCFHGHLPLPHRLAGLAAKVGVALAATNEVASNDEVLSAVLNNASINLAEAGRGHEALVAVRRAVELYERLAAGDPARFELDLTRALTNLANRLGEAGDHPAALATDRRAIEIRERLAQRDPARFEPGLALSLNNVAGRLSDAGDGAAALSAAQRAAEIYERLAAGDPASFEPGLAMSLSNLATALSEAREDAGAVAAAQRAVEIEERLVATSPAQFEPDLAMGLSTLSTVLCQADQGAAALAAARRAVELHERLAAGNPARFEPELARGFASLAAALSRAGQGAAALAAGRQAVEIYERLSASNPARFEPDLAKALNNLTGMLRQACEATAALATARRAVEIFERLASEDVARFEFHLATSLGNLAAISNEAGDGTAALAARRSAIEIYERLAILNAARFESELAASINNLAGMLYEAGEGAAALPLARRAVEIYERLALANSERFEPRLAASLRNLAAILSNAGERVAAVPIARRAVEVYERLALGNPAQFELELARSLNNLVSTLHVVGEGAAALAATRRAVAISERLAATNPARFEPELATGLNNLAGALSQTGEGAAALAVARRAVEVYERLALGNPASFESGLAMSLTNLATCNQTQDAVEDAANSIARALPLWRKAVEVIPQRFFGGYFIALQVAAPMLRAAGRDQEAKEVEDELAEWMRRMETGSVPDSE
jgi:Tetratricopeptide repeat